MKRTYLLVALTAVLLLMLWTSMAIADEIVPYANAGNSILMDFDITGGKAVAAAQVTSMDSDNTTKITVYVKRRKSGTSDWINAASASGVREAKASCTAVSGDIYYGYAVGYIYNANGELVDKLTISSNMKGI